MIRILYIILLAASLCAQTRFGKFEIFDTSGRTRIRLDSASGVVLYDTSGNQTTSVTQSWVEVRGGTTTGSRLQANGIYLRDSVGNQRAYMVSAASPFGGGLFLSKASGADKFKVDTGDSDAPDSVNGYKVGGTSAIDGSRNADLTSLAIGGASAISSVRAGALTRLDVRPSAVGTGGVYLRDGSNNQNGYVVAADRSLGFGGGFDFTNSSGASKFTLDTADSGAPDSKNGYKVNGTSVIDGSRNASVVNLTVAGTATGLVDTANNQVVSGIKNFNTIGGINASGGITVSGTSVIDYLRNASFASLSVNGISIPFTHACATGWLFSSFTIGTNGYYCASIAPGAGLAADGSLGIGLKVNVPTLSLSCPSGQAVKSLNMTATGTLTATCGAP